MHNISNKANKTILLTGASGKIGRQLFYKLKKRNCYGIYNKKKISNNKNLIKLDLRNKKKLKNLVKKIKPNIVIHLAGMKDPGLNEKQPNISKELNLQVTKNLVKSLNNNVHFIFFSTDKIYDGEKKKFNEKSKLSPIGFYGKYKLMCESLIKKKFKKHHIIRMSLVHFDGKDKNFSIIDKFIFLLKKKLKVKVFKNVKRCFVDIEDLIKFIPKIFENKKFGIYNVGSKLSTYSFRVKKICKKKKIKLKDNLIEINGQAKPISMELDTKKLQNNFNFKFT